MEHVLNHSIWLSPAYSSSLAGQVPASALLYYDTYKGRCIIYSQHYATLLQVLYIRHKRVLILPLTSQEIWIH